MPTFTKRVENNTIRIQVEIALAEGQPGYRVMAKVDTGATTTAVTTSVIKILGSPNPVSRGSYGTAGREIVHTSIYGLYVAVPVSKGSGETIFMDGGPLTVFELPYQPIDHDVIVGMDLLTRFHITMWDGNFVMSN